MTLLRRRYLLLALGAGVGAPMRFAAAEWPPFQALLRDQLRRPRLGWASQARGDPLQWRDRGLERARALILDPRSALCAPTAELINEEFFERHRARRLNLNLGLDTHSTHGVQALQLLPHGPGPFPAVILLHDHGAQFDIGKEKMIAPWDDSARLASAKVWVERFYGGRFLGDELVRRGYSVLAVDALGWGERARPGFARDDQQALASNLFNLGRSWAGLIATEDVAALSWLRAQANIDRDRVAALGFSFGGFRAWQLAALSQQLAACAATHWMCTREGLMRHGGHTLQGQSAFAMLHPGLATELDHPDVAALAAPRPMLMHAGAEDPLFPIDGVKQAFAQLEEVWSAHGARHRLDARIWPGRHVFSLSQQQWVFDWLDAQLQNSR